MNKILQLFDEKFVINLFRQKILPYYPEFIDIKQIKIKPYKNLVWKTTYHVVLSFDTYFLKADGEESRVLIVCSAHNEEPRKNIYLALKYLWTAGCLINLLICPNLCSIPPSLMALSIKV